MKERRTLAASRRVGLAARGRAQAAGLVARLREGIRTYRDRYVMERSDPGFHDALAAASEIEGFTFPGELSFLYHLARAPEQGAIVEIGSYLGRSTVVLARAARAAGGESVVAVDPHTGDLTLAGREPVVTELRADTRRTFLANIARAGVSSHVRLLHTTSVEAATAWSREPVRLLFVDGLHTREAVLADYRAWSPYLLPGACVVFDDFLTYRSVRAAVRELIAAGSFRDKGRVLVGKMIAFGPREALGSPPVPPGARLLARLGDRSLDRLIALMGYSPEGAKIG